MITQLAENQAALKQQLDKHGHRLVKITNEGPGLPTVMEQVAYTGLFLTGRALEWFKPYLTKIQLNGMSTTNVEV